MGGLRFQVVSVEGEDEMRQRDLARSVACAALLLPAASASAERRPLAQGWALQSSAQVKASGEELSRAGFAPEGWQRISVPNTVVGALVEAKVSPIPTSG
jgi:hypothetical protein